MSKNQTTYAPQLPWENRWQQPDINTLVNQLEPPRSETFQNFMNGLRQWEQLEENMIWAGDGWKWTAEFNLAGHKGHATGPDNPDAFAYVVCDPRPEPVRPMLAIPLSNELIAHVPFRRLNRYIRDGIKSAKLSVDIVWGVWSPGANTEVEHLLDLCKRKIRFLTGDAKLKPNKD